MAHKREWLIALRGNMSQEQIALLAKISRSAYSNIELGKRNPSVSMAKAIAKVFKVDWNLFFETECFKPKQTKRSA